MTDPRITLADLLWEAAATGRPIAPLREAAAAAGAPATADEAYAIQRINRDRRVRGGDRVVGRKIGLTSLAVQRQLGVDSPDFGDLWASTSHGDGDAVPLATLIQPKVEAEVALVLERDVPNPDATVVDVIRASAFALAALEIVDSRIADWKIGLFDTIADNASAAAFVLGADPVRLDRIALREARMVMTRGAESVSEGVGSACMGHPLNAAAWLARTLARRGDPLRAGDIVLTGALGPMVPARAGDAFEARIEGLGGVSVRFA
ncbi:MAG: fumarylacetoacetate hydrolase family protein [Rubrivivax sp.]|nr:fumarylacetoacetate hydrolase family protein [Rubrivivax sp.]